MYLGMRAASGEMSVGMCDVLRWAASVPWHTSEDNEDAEGPTVKAQLGERMPRSSARPLRRRCRAA